MSAAINVIKSSLNTSAFCVRCYLDDLSDEQLLIRPVAGANHMAWQLGHLIVSEHDLINMVCPGSMPTLPDGFAERYSKETSKLDDPGLFDLKADYLRLMRELRQATLTALERLSDEDLDKPAPEAIREYSPTVASTFALQATHAMMHSGQWVIVRRQLGLKALF